MSLTDQDRTDIQADIEQLKDDLWRTLNNLPPSLPGLEQKRAAYVEGYTNEIAELERILASDEPTGRSD